VVGFGTLVALAVGVVLFLGLSSAAKNTQELLQNQAEAVVDLIDQRIGERLSPAVAQAQWIADSFSKGNIDLANTQKLDAFMRGALGATPQIAGIAIVTPLGRSRRWTRDLQDAIDEDWSTNPGLLEWVESGRNQVGSSWRPPFWTATLNTTVVMQDTPLLRNGKYAGMLAQVVPIAELSEILQGVEQRTSMLPFILHGKERVLAHPGLSDWIPQDKAAEVPLPMLSEIGDTALQRIWTPDNASLYMLRDIQGANATGAQVGDDYYIYLYREIERFGPWTIGAYFNIDVRGSREFERLLVSLYAGLAVLIASVLIAAYAGRRVSKPVQLLSQAARAVETGGLEQAPEVPPSRIREFDDASRSFNAMVTGLRERELIRETLGRFVPEEVAQTLLSDGGQLQVTQTQATVLFCDLDGFTALTESLGPVGIMKLLNEYFEEMVAILEAHRGVVTQFQGDAILATFNVPVADPGHADNALHAALEMQAAVQTHEYAGQRVNNRIGVNTGSLVAGAVGAQGRLSYTVHGDAVNLAARLEAMNKDLGTRILVSGYTAPLVAGFNLRPVGETTVRGQTTPVALYELLAG
jgi:adenylate cyclase